MQLNTTHTITKLITILTIHYEFLIHNEYYRVSINLKLTPKSEEETGYEEEMSGVLICLL